MEPDWQEAALLLSRPAASVQLAERWLRVRDKDGLLVPLRANRAQRAYEARRGPANIVLKARQMGMTTWAAGRFLLRTVLVPGSTTVLVAHTRESGEAIFRTVTRMWEHLPDAVRRHAGLDGRANAGQLTFPRIDSEFRVVSAGEPNAGRGLTMTNLHCSEVARWPGDAAGTLAGLRGALSPGGELVLESTPNGAYGCFYTEWMNAEERGTAKHFLPWWFEPVYVSAPVHGDLREDERALMEREGLTAGQIGFRRSLESQFGAMRGQEFAEDAVSCFRASGSSFFDVDTLERQRTAATPPIEQRRGGQMQIWLPPVPGRRYVVAADPAGGGSDGDYAALQVVDVRTGAQCAELRSHMSPRELAAASAALAAEYNGAVLAVERNNHGAAVLAYLETEREHRWSMYAGRDGLAGWRTDAASRPAMLAYVSAVLSKRPELFRSMRLMEECRSFVTDGAGRPAAAAGSHDDLVMAMAIAQAVRKEVIDT